MSLLPAKSIEVLIHHKNGCNRASGELYLYGSQYRDVSPEFEEMMYEAARLLGQTRLLLEKAILLASSERRTK
jgi:hypothetical protein